MSGPQILVAKLGVLHKGVMDVPGAKDAVDRLLNIQLYTAEGQTQGIIIRIQPSGIVSIDQQECKNPYDLSTIQSISELIEAINRVYRDTHGLEEDQ